MVALGSFARRELCPQSDIDLLVLHEGRTRHDLGAIVLALCDPLWAAGLPVGHAVRTVRESVRAAGERVETATALTDRRLVVGDRGLLDDLASRMTRWLRRNGGDLLDRLAVADGQRHHRAGTHTGMLAPDLKNGRGGLRDLHSLRWAAACVLGETGLDPLVGARYVSASDRRDLAAAGERLLEARCALHLVSGRTSGDVLRLDLRREVASRLGMHDDELLRAVGLAARTVAHVHGRTWPLLHADARAGRRRAKPSPADVANGVVLVDGLIGITPARRLATDPSLGWRAVGAAARRSTHLDRAAAARLARETAEQGSLPWDAEAREALLHVLRQGERGLSALADADHVGLLTAHLPEWPRVRGRPQRNPFHTYDLDTHGWQAVAELVAIGEGLLEPAHADLWSELADSDSLLLATWLHDVGKAWSGDHSEAGALVAARWVRHMGFRDRVADQVARLVRHHLLLPVAATRRDLDDAEEIAGVARQVGDVETLDGLYLLSLADARATGPGAHSPWRYSLIAELHGRVRRLLLAGVDATASVARDPAEVAAAARATPGAGPGLETLLHAPPPRYLLAASAEQCLAHARLLEPRPASGELRAAWRDGPTADTETLSVVAADHRGLVADCAGVLAAHGVVVLDARVFTLPASGLGPPTAVDWFTVRVPAGVDRSAVAGALADAAAGQLDVAGIVAARERRRDARPPVLADPVGVSIRIERAASHTRIEVHAPDAPGSLYRLASALATADLDLAGARVATLGPEVRDVFLVTNEDLPADLPARLRAAAAHPN